MKNLYVVGLGPGNPELQTPEATQILTMAQCIVGYHLYLDLVPEKFKIGKKIISSGMRQEIERCESAITSTLVGNATALVCSGDPGIYAMASLVIELLEKKNLLSEINLHITPGIPALCAASACLGAPIGHDFACVSLSDLLTPYEIILRRLKAAMEADFVCILYNPRSRGRQEYLEQAFALARKFRSAHCPVGLVRNAGRPEQKVLLSTLNSLDCALVDMLSIVIIGNSETRFAGNFMLTPRGYSRKFVK